MQEIEAKTIIGKPKFTGWFGIDYNMNLYRGCCHGCIYCDSRCQCYGIEDFDTVRIKRNAIPIMQRELISKRKVGVIGIGAMSDSYNPFEREYQLTRKALELIERYRFGVSIETKSDLIVRDVDLLSQISKNYACITKMTITCADDALSKRIEPNVCSSSARFQAIEKMANAGIYTGVIIAPTLPFINDTAKNILDIVKYTYNSGAKFILAMYGVTLRSNQRIYFYQQLDNQFPGLTQKYLSEYGTEESCISPKMAELQKSLVLACNQVGIKYKMSDIINEYKGKTEIQQLSLFDRNFKTRTE